MFVMVVFKHAQPALLYLVPTCVGFPLALAWFKGELAAMLKYVIVSYIHKTAFKSYVFSQYNPVIYWTKMCTNNSEVIILGFMFFFNYGIIRIKFTSCWNESAYVSMSWKTKNRFLVELLSSPSYLKQTSSNFYRKSIIKFKKNWM